MNEKQLAKLIKQNVAKVEKSQSKKTKAFDPTLDATRRPGEKDPDDEIERTAFFKEMKRREF